MSSVKVTRGARLLRAYLKASGRTVPEFAEAAGISRYVLQDALRGTDGRRSQRISVDLAVAVERAAGLGTDGAPIVPVDAWCSSTLRVARGQVGRVHDLGRRARPSTEAA